MKKLFCALAFCALLFSLTACAPNEPVKPEEPTEPMGTVRTDDIVILFTNDVHCEVSANIGYSGLAAYKKSVEAKTPYVTLVDCGDAVQGSSLGMVTKGELPVKVMNEVGYDLAALGNHEFDYGMERLAELIGMSKAEYLCCNLSYTGKGETPLPELKPYKLLTYGDTKVAFVGVTTPDSIQQSTPAYFQEDGEYVYDFCGESGKTLYDKVQKAVDAALEEGADYVVLLSHMGVNPMESPFTSYELVQNTTGVDAVLDAHSHTEIPTRVEKNRDGEDVLIAQTGTGLTHIGQLVISPSGFLTIGYISDYEIKDPDMDSFIESLTAETDAIMNTVLTTLDHDLPITAESGVRIVRTRETAIGDLVADAYRAATGADFAYINGGGVRAGLLAGDITYQDLINVNPFGNNVCSVEVTGQEILDMLECFYSTVEADFERDGAAVGENGNFGQISGLRCVVHTDIPTSIVVDGEGMLVEVGESRRVSDVMIEKNGEYLPLDSTAVYTFASVDYTIKNGGCAMGLLLSGHTLVLDSIGTDYQILTDYVQALGGDFSAYVEPAGRVTVAP